MHKLDRLVFCDRRTDTVGGRGAVRRVIGLKMNASAVQSQPHRAMLLVFAALLPRDVTRYYVLQ